MVGFKTRYLTDWFDNNIKLREKGGRVDDKFVQVRYGN